MQCITIGDVNEAHQIGDIVTYTNTETGWTRTLRVTAVEDSTVTYEPADE